MRVSLLLILALLPAAASAQSELRPRLEARVVAPGILRGVVFDAAGRPVAGAAVRVEGTATVTDGEGGFVVRLAPGVARVEIAAGELGGVIEGVAVASGQATELLVVLRPGGALEVDIEAPQVAEDVAPVATATVALGAVRGRVVAAEGGRPVAGARVFVRGAAVDLRSDAEGAFAVELPEGARELTVIHPGFATKNQALSVRGGETSEVELALEPQATTLGEMVVLIPKPDYGSVASQLALRREAAAVQDSVGLEDIKKSPDSNASSATRRIVGATVVGGAYLNVRGLQGRYTNVRLNGVTLPSTDPELPGFQIDLFPVNLITSLTVAKTFTPEIPGDFAGGSLNVITADFPPEEKLSLSLSVGGQADVVGRDYLSYPGGSLDFLGIDDGSRGLPAGVPDRRLTSQGRNGLPRDQVDLVARSFSANWELEERPAIPDLSLSMSYGDTRQLEEGRRLGYLFTLGYRRNTVRVVERLTNVTGNLESGTLRARESLEREVGATDTQLGALATAAYRLGEDDELRFVSMVTQIGDDRAAQTTGLFESEGRFLRQTQLRFTSRRLLFNQLLGKHREIFEDADLDWQLNVALVSRAQPDTRDLVYEETPAGYAFRQITGSGERLFTDLGQVDVGGGADLGYRLAEEVKLKAGWLGRFSDRAFTARRFGHDWDGTPEQYLLPPNVLFGPEYQGVAVRMEEKTQPTDGYGANEVSGALYLMGDAALAEGRLRVVGGLRTELFHQAIEGRSPYATTQELKSSSRTDVDVLPSLGGILELGEGMGLRASYGGTVARPLVRELAPFLVQDFVRRRTSQGNPDLVRTYVHNFDLRWEAFPGEGEVLAASAFFKLFEDPIETVVIDTEGNLSFDNIPTAQNYGAELEARINLSRLAEVLSSVSLMANLALIHSRVQLAPSQLGASTSDIRPLAGQSPFVANLSLSWEPEESKVSANVFYNVFGRRIVEVGRNGLPDVYEEPFHSVDATFFYKWDESWTLSVFGRNLLNQPVRVDQSSFAFMEFNRGVTLGMRLSWSP